jgi:hypothetical protein
MAVNVTLLASRGESHQIAFAILLGDPRARIKDKNEAPKFQCLFAHDRSLDDETL